MLFLIGALFSVQATAGLAKEGDGPIDKVVSLLEDLKKDLENDEKTEQKIFDEYACWCTKATGEKAHTIKLAHEKIQMLSTAILQNKGTVAVRTADLEELAKKIAENEASQASATAVREKEHNSFIAEKVDLEQAITALEKAIVVLGGKAFLQGAMESSEAVRQRAVASVRSVVNALPAKTRMTPKQLAAIESFTTNSATSLGESKNPSATIIGILKDMYDTMTTDLEGQTMEEAKKQRAFEDLIAELKGQLKDMQEQVTEKEKEKAEAEVQLAEAMQIMDDSQKQMDADIEFYDLTMEKCKAKDKEWMERSKARDEEIEGIKKALEILTSDDAKKLFGKFLQKPGMEKMFLQLSDDEESSLPAQKAYQVLKAGAQKAKSLRLAALAASVRTVGPGHFDKILKEIDKMIQTLKDEEKEDIEQRDWCKEEYQTNDLEKSKIKWKIERNEAMITKLEKRIEKLDEQITATVEDIENTEKEIEELEDARKEEHEDFKEAKKNNQDCIELLGKAKDALSEFYEKNKVFLQEEIKKEIRQEPDGRLSKKGSRKNQSMGIIAIMQMLIEDLEHEIKTGVKNEVGAQVDYEKQLEAAKKLIEKLEATKVNLEDDKAAAEKDKADEEDKMDENKKDLTTNEDYKKEIEPDCDWMLENFEERIEKRRAEMQGLETAKEYLSGAKPPSMLETSIGKNYDDDQFQRVGFEKLRR